MAEDLSRAQLREQAEERERLDEEWTAIAEERRLLDEDKEKVIEERRRLKERRRQFKGGKRLFKEEKRMIEDERRMIKDKKMSMHEDRERMIEEREDIDRLRENALSGIDDSVRNLERTARVLAEGGPQIRSEPTILPETSTTRPTSPDNGSDSLGLSAASDEMKNLWRQIESPQEWTRANSDNLFELFTKHTGREILPGARPVAILDRLATKNSCLTTSLRKLAFKLDNGPAHPCSVCRSKSRACIGVDFTAAGPDNEPYDEDGQGKRWQLSIRND